MTDILSQIPGVLVSKKLTKDEVLQQIGVLHAAIDDLTGETHLWCAMPEALDDAVS